MKLTAGFIIGWLSGALVVGALVARMWSGTWGKDGDTEALLLVGCLLTVAALIGISVEEHE